MKNICHQKISNEGQKINTLFNLVELKEIFLFKEKFFLINNIKNISEITEEEALLYFIHPEAVNTNINIKEIFSNELEIISNNWTHTEEKIIYQSKKGICFFSLNNFNNTLKITVTDPGKNLSDLICLNTDHTTKEVLHLNNEFFLKDDTKTIKINSDTALKYYLDFKSKNLIREPQKYFKLKKITQGDKTKEVIFSYGDNLKFKYMKNNKNVRVEKIQTRKKRLKL